MRRTSVIYRVIALTACAGMVLGMTGCAKAQNPFTEKSDVKLSSFEECPVELKAEVIWNRKVKVTVANKGHEAYTWGQPYKLEYQYYGEWYSVPSLPDHAWPLIGYTLGYGEDVFIEGGLVYAPVTAEETERLDDMFGDIPEGHYRIIKDFSTPVGGPEENKYFVAAEFDLGKATTEPEPLQKSAVDPSKIVTSDSIKLDVEYIKCESGSKMITIRYKVASNSYSVETSLEYQKDGEWYVIPIASKGGAWEECMPVSAYEEISLDVPLEQGHYRFLFTCYPVVEDPDPSNRIISSIASYEFDI
ncbi:MAG: hypothetical protein J6X33_04990 [Clostridiales bacterium]|nr:hypothetical protein [Clostridiales bacterium]